MTAETAKYGLELIGKEFERAVSSSILGFRRERVKVRLRFTYAARKC